MEYSVQSSGAKFNAKVYLNLKEVIPFIKTWFPIRSMKDARHSLSHQTVSKVYIISNTSQRPLPTQHYMHPLYARASSSPLRPRESH